MDWVKVTQEAEAETRESGRGHNAYARVQEAAEDAYDLMCVMRADLQTMLGESEYVPGSIMFRLLSGEENRITVWREHRGLSQKDLAAKANMTAAQLCEIENGKKSGSIKTLQKLAKALNVTVDNLLPKGD
jgi:ribosome-binding protein aMBF1 (putative translation factor)